MAKFVVEMCFGIGVTVNDVEADNKEDAEKKARDIAREDVYILDGIRVETSSLEFEETTFIEEVEDK